MQTLGLSDSTPKTSSRLRDLFWPDLSVDTSAESACDTAYCACFAIAGLTTILAFFTSFTSSWILVDALLFVLIGFGLRKKWRTAAIAGFLLYLLETVTSMAGGRGPGVLTILILVILFNSIRASFAYHRMHKMAVAEDKVAEVFD